MPTKREKKFRQTFEKMEGFSFVTPVTGLDRPNTGKEDDDDVLALEISVVSNFRNESISLICLRYLITS
jgi:hypothetical protein